MIVGKVVLVLSVVYFSFAAELPPFIKKCPKEANEEFEKCALSQSHQVVEALKDGYAPFGIQKLDPLHIKHLDLPLSKRFDVDMNNVTITGLTTAVFSKLTPKFENGELKSLTIKLDIPTLNIKGVYSANGYFLIVTVNGGGDANIDIKDLVVDLKMDFTTETKDGEKYYKMPKEFHVDIDFVKMKSHFDNMVPDKKVNAIVNAFMNANTKMVFNILKPGILNVVRDIVHSIVAKMMTNVPAKNF